jgi:transposase InsO family protein
MPNSLISRVISAFTFLWAAFRGKGNHVWSYDFVEAQTHDGRKVRLMTLIDEFTRECLAIRVARRINSLGVLETMAEVMLTRGVPEHIRSDNGAEMTAKIVRQWLASVGAKTLYIAPGSPTGACCLGARTTWHRPWWLWDAPPA